MNIKTRAGAGQRFQTAVTDEQAQNVFNSPVHTLNDLQIGVPEHLAQQISFYQTQMKIEAQTRQYLAHDTLKEASAYRVQAEETHVIDGHQVNIFAPFIMENSALKTITRPQVIFFVLLGLVLLVSILINWEATAIVVLALVTAFYSGNLLITFWFSLHTLEESGDIQISDEVVEGLSGVDWPSYTILCPLYRETEVVAQFAKAMRGLDYPVSKLQILFLTEADDEETRDAIRAANLPSHFQIVTVPDGNPRTKPRACNYGLLEATGDFIVIYDAEDIPDPLQLKKAVLAFASHGPELGCVQAKLNFYNSTQNILTRLFTIEYSTWFDTTLPGLQWGEYSLPLGGTSNHFRASTLRELGAWDAFNVTEDCDLGLRLSRKGFRTAVLDSTTYEEANPNVKNWIRQRSRWIKGYMQTYLIHMRNPAQYLHPSLWREFLSLQVIVGGRTAVLLINPIMWVMTILYFAVWPHLQKTYDVLFPPALLYTAVICLVFGNLTYIYTHFIGCLQRRQFELVKWTLLMPLYWAMTSYAAFKAFKQLITNPHYWEKTKHGLHLNTPAMLGQSDKPLSAESTQLAETIHEQQPQAVHISEPYLLLAEDGNGHSANVVAQGWIGYSPNDLRNGHNGNGRNGHNGQFKGNGYGSRALADGSVITNRQRVWQKLTGWLPEDRWLTITIVTACIASIIATLYFFNNHFILLYKDSSSHLGIARLVFDNAKPGLAQLGSVWLPLPHLAMLPFTSVDYLWRTGLAGACVSMPSYIIAAIYIYLSARKLTNNRLASYLGTLVFILNPNVLYLQSTPLTEPIAAATITAACYYFVSWLKDDRAVSLILLGASVFLASLTRYDGWALFGGFLVLIPFISLLKRQKRHRIEADVLVYAVVGCLGIVLWFAWNALIFGDPLYFQRGEYSSQAQHEQLIRDNMLFAYHDWGVAITTLLGLAYVTLGPGLFFLSIIGLVVFLIQRRFSLEIFAGLVFLIPFAFYIYSLYSGQVTIHLPMLVSLPPPDNYFNSRFGMIVVPPAALFVAIYIARLSKISTQRFLRWSQHFTIGYRSAAVAVCTIIIIGQSVLITATGVVSFQEGQYGRSCQPPQRIVDYMAKYYDGGYILLDTFANSSLYILGQVAGVEFKNIVYEGSGALWRQALDDPASVVDWIVIHPGSGLDKVAKAIDITTPTFRLDYTLVMQEDDGRSLYHRGPVSSLVERPIREETLINNVLCPG